MLHIKKSQILFIALAVLALGMCELVRTAEGAASQPTTTTPATSTAPNAPAAGTNAPAAAGGSWYENTYVLWGGLILGIVLVGGGAYVLWKSSNKSSM